MMKLNEKHIKEVMQKLEGDPKAFYYWMAGYLSMGVAEKFMHEGDGQYRQSLTGIQPPTAS